MSAHVQSPHVLRRTAWFTAVLYLEACLAVAFPGQKNITAGQTAILSCQVPKDTHISVVEWRRPDINEEYVLVYRDEQLDPEEQHSSFKNRTDLQDRQMKGGDVSLILKDVTAADTGTYECRIFIQGVVMDGHPVCTIDLCVHPPGQPRGHDEDGHIGPIVILSVFGVLVAVAVGAVIYIIYIKKNTSS